MHKFLAQLLIKHLKWRYRKRFGRYSPADTRAYKTVEYVGNAGNNVISTDIDLSNKGLLWLKFTSGSDSHTLVDTERPANPETGYYPILATSSATGNTERSEGVYQLSDTGFAVVGGDTQWNVRG